MSPSIPTHSLVHSSNPALAEIIVKGQSPCSHAFYKLPDMTHSMFSERHCWLSLFFIFRLSEAFTENGSDPGASFFSHDILHLNPSDQLRRLSAAKFQSTSWRLLIFSEYSEWAPNTVFIVAEYRIKLCLNDDVFYVCEPERLRWTLRRKTTTITSLPVLTPCKTVFPQPLSFLLCFIYIPALCYPLFINTFRCAQEEKQPDKNVCITKKCK